MFDADGHTCKTGHWDATASTAHHPSAKHGQNPLRRDVERAYTSFLNQTLVGYCDERASFCFLPLTRMLLPCFVVRPHSVRFIGVGYTSALRSRPEHSRKKP